MWGSALGRGHVTVGAGLFRREEIRDSDRDHSRASWTPGGSFADAFGVSVGGNTLFITTGDKTAGRSLGTCKGSAYTGVLDRPFGLSGTGCGFAYADIAWHHERHERESVFLNLDYPIRKNVDMYFDARLAQSDNTFRYAPSVGTFSFTPSKALSQATLDTLQRDFGRLPEEVEVAHRFAGHGNRDWRTNLDEHAVTLGFKGRVLNGIGYNAYIRSHRHDTAEIGDTFVSTSLIRQAINGGRYDIENPLSTAPGHLAAIRETGLRLTRDVVTDNKTFRVAFDGSAFALGGGDVRYAVGTTVVHEEKRDTRHYRDVNGKSYEPSDVLGSGGDSFSGERRRWSTFTEVSLPLHDKWDLVFAGRVDEHDDVGATFSQQLASKYRLNTVFALRGSWSRGSKAPSLSALHLRGFDYPYIDCDTKTFAGNPQGCARQQVERLRIGNPDLKPDDAESFSLGAEMSLGPFSLSADWFRVELSDVPALLSAQSVLDLEAAGRLPSGAGVLRNGNHIDQITSTYVNAGERDVAGINVHGRVDWKTDWADVAFAAYWSHVTQEESRVLGEQQPGDHPRNRVHTVLRASRGNVTANWSVLGVSGYSNTSGEARYKAWMGHNLTLRWQNALRVKGLDLMGGILNIGNRGPSAATPGQVATTLDSSKGRTFFLTAGILFNP